MSSKSRRIKKAAAGILAAAVVAVGMPVLNGVGVLPEMSMTAYAADTTVTWNNSDISVDSISQSFTKDGVTMNVTGMICDPDAKNFSAGTFTSTAGNFTKIEVTATQLTNMGSGWSVSGGKVTWTGSASSTVSFGGSDFMDGIWGMGDGVTMVFTIEPPTVPATATYSQVGDDYPAAFSGDRAASLWKVTVTPGTDAITTLSVKVNDKTPDAPLSADTTFSGDSGIVFGVVLNGTAADVTSFTALVNGEAVTTAVE